jgi:hypothetical protein
MFGASLALTLWVCEIRRMNLQAGLDQAVIDHRASAATLRYDLERAIPRVVGMWAPYVENPRDLHGQAFCTDVRSMVLHMREQRGQMPGDTLLTSQGNGLSVRMSDGRGMDFRCRRWPSTVLNGERVRIVVTPGGGSQRLVRSGSEPEAQMALDEGLDTAVFPAALRTPVVGDQQLFALWWPTEDLMGLEEAVLAWVVDVDNASRVQILATSPLPPVTDSPLLSVPKRTVKPSNDFGDLEPPAFGALGDPNEPA